MAKTYKTSETVDFVIVGSGASGGIMARELSRAGNSVVVMEQGPRMAPGQFEHDELKYRMLAGITNSPVDNPQTFRKDASQKAERVANTSLTYARVVGGSSVHFNANFWRLHEIDFIEGSRFGGIPGASLVDWPITYAELEPYYTMVEWEVGVAGLAGANPFDSFRSKPYPMPPLPVKSSGVLMEKGGRALGLHPYPSPMAINSVMYKNRPPCAQCGLCGGYGCEVKAKSSSVWTVIPEAEATGNCEIRSESYVFRIGMDRRTNRATGVYYYDADRKEQFQKAKAVVVCANGAETPRLLLNSATNGHSHGLANSSGVVGKHLMFNKGGGAQARFEQPLNEYKGANVTRVIQDFYDSDPKRGFYGGGGFDARSGGPLTWGQNVPRGTPTWGPEFKEYLESYTYWMSCSGHGTSLAQETNRVDIDPELKDAWGVPAIRVTYKDHPDDVKHANWQVERAREIMDAAGAKQIVAEPVGEARGGVHLLGTCRMGNDPATSVIDKHHRTHDVKNLFISDGSSMVTSGRGQPTLTIEALAFRAAEHIVKFAKAGEI